MRLGLIMLGVAVGLFVGLSGAAYAQDQKLSVELNRVDQQGEACRFDWRVTNRTESGIDDLAADIVLFDQAGVNIARMVVPFGALAREKSVLRSFQLRPFECARVGEALLNGVAQCVADPPLDCLAAIAVSSRASIPLSR